MTPFIEHLAGEWPRYVIVGEVAALLWCAVLTGGAASARLDRDLRIRDWVLMYVPFCVFVAVTTNIALPDAPLTPGTLVLAGVLAPAVVVAGWITARIMLRGIRDHREAARRSVIRNVDEVVDLLTHMHHAEPCANPECADIRDRGRHLAGLPAAPTGR